MEYSDSREFPEKDIRLLLKEYLTEKFSRSFTVEEIETVDDIMELLEKYRE